MLERLTSPNGSQFMLAAGAGLLSGNNWREGLSSAAQNVLGVQQSKSEQEQAAAAQQLAIAQAVAEQRYRQEQQQLNAEERERNDQYRMQQLAGEEDWRQAQQGRWGQEQGYDQSRLSLDRDRLALDQQRHDLAVKMAPFRAFNYMGDDYDLAPGLMGGEMTPYGAPQDPGMPEEASGHPYYQNIGYMMVDDEQAPGQKKKVNIPRGEWKDVGNVVTEDGTPLGAGFFNKRVPGIWYRADDGELKQAPAGARKASVSAGGPLSTSAFYDLENQLITDEVGLGNIVRYIESVGDTKVGLGRLADSISAKIKTLFANPLNRQELATQVAQGQLQGLLGAVRTEVLGPGMLTEYDAARLVAYLGGDVDALQNPQRVEEALKNVFDAKLQRYKMHVEQYNRQAPAFGVDYRSQRDLRLPSLTQPQAAPAPVVPAVPDPGMEELLKKYGG